jgi:hypothetical protein
MGEQSSSSSGGGGGGGGGSGTIGFPPFRSGSDSFGYHSKSNVLTYPDEQKRSSRLIPLAYHSKRNDMSYNRNLSPGGRRLTNPARASDGSFDPYYSQRHSVYASPRASTDRVIPISSQTYLNPPSTTSASTSSGSRLTSGYDAYSGRPRRSSMLENTRSGSTNPPAPRSRPTVVQSDIRPSSPPRRDRSDYYVQPASSKEPKRQFEHKKVYSVDDGSAKLVADIDVGSGGERHHKRKESGDKLGYNRSAGYDGGRKAYHASGKSGRSLEDDNAFSYTDPASMYKDTEPRWRETRPRRGSVDRGGASRERPVSMIEPYADPRRSTRDIGPPPSQRGWDKIQDLGRTRSTRDPVPHSPSRGARERDESRGRYSDNRDPYYIAPRKSSADRSRTTHAVHQDRPVERYDQEYDDRREPRHHERRLSATRHKDRSVSRRGFGVRTDSTDRYGTRGSDESFEARNRDAARDSGFADGNRRDAPLDSQYPDRERKYHAQESKRKEHGRSYEDYDRDSDRERSRKDRDADRDGYRERHHHRRDSDRDDKKDSDSSFSGAAKIAAGGLGAAATLFGLNREKGKKEEREREEREEQERAREQMRQREHERPREQERRHDERRDREIVEPEKRRRGGGSNEDDPQADRPREPYADLDRGLGFAFEGPGDGNKPREVPRDVPREPAAPAAPYDLPPPQPPRLQHRTYDREPTSDRDSDRPHDNKPSHSHAAPPTNDADEDYRRRMEQVQRELGLPAQDPTTDSDPDRERRRREREIRQAERQGRKLNGHHSEASSHYDQPAPSGGLRASFEDEASQAPSQSTWSSAPTDSGKQELRRRASVLDSLMDAGSMAQVIDNSQSEKRENRVRIVDPPSDEEDKKPKGILKRPTEKFPENPDAVREGVAPLKDVSVARYYRQR